MVKKMSKGFTDGIREGKKYAEYSAGFQEGLREAEEARRDKVDLSKIEDEDEKRLIIRYQIIDELFDELLAKLLTFMEACGFCEDGTPLRSTKSKSTRRAVKSIVREIQNRVKDEVPITEKMLDSCNNK